MDTVNIQRLNLRMLVVISGAIIIALSTIVFVSLRLAENYVVPELEAKAVTQGQALTTLIGQPLSYSISLNELVGVDDLFREVKEGNPEFGFLAITDGRGEILFQSGDSLSEARGHLSNPSLIPLAAKQVESGVRPKAVNVGKHHVVSLPIYSKDRAIAGMLHVGVRSSYIKNILRELLLDLAVILVVSLFVAYEVLYFISGGKLSGQFELLKRALESASGHDFTSRVPFVGRDELGRVATLTNAAIGRLNERYAALVEKGRQSGLFPASTEGVAQPAESSVALGLPERMKFGATGEGASDFVNYLGRLRAPLFLSLVAEELSRSFIPLYAKELYKPLPGISTEFVVGMPIMLFMLMVALLQPVIASWSERVGRKHSLLIGIMLGCFAFVMSANAFTIYDLLLWRTLSGISWAIVFVASQGFILDKATPESRTRDIAFFVGVIMVAQLCGPPVGGILADNVGFRATFFVSAALSLLGAVLLLRYLPADPYVPDKVVRKLRMREILTVLANRRFLALVLSAGIPAKIILISFCYYLMPLYITHIGNSTAMTGRVLMLYALLMVIGVPLVARASDRLRRRKEFIGVGLVLSGLSGLLVLLGENIFIAAAVVVLLGIAQAISIAPQTAIVADICADDIDRLGEGTVYGVYRLMERIGNSLGPVLGAVALRYSGFTGSFVAIGLLLVLGGVVFLAAFRNVVEGGAKVAEQEGVQP